MKLRIFPPIFFFIIFVSLIFFVKDTYAQDCPNRFVTFVNPIRGRGLWGDKSIKPLVDQYQILTKYSLPATWLLQYDALEDGELVNTVKMFEFGGEKGVFLEVSKNLAEDSGVAYPEGVRWSDPGAVFLSAYSPSQRRAIINQLYKKFKNEFGYYPKSVGAWWIDSYSLNFIKQKYGLNAILVVADQKTTDSYGVWGGWWGVPYYPSRENVLVPDEDLSLGAVVIQWAQRDPLLAYGEGLNYSSFSLQANDYIGVGEDTSYFINLAKKYLDCGNNVGQLTIGMETGMEAVTFANEFENQIKALLKIPGLRFVTMSDFALDFKEINLKNPSQVKIDDWLMTPNFRENNTLGDKINYIRGVSFRDYFMADRNSFLDRNLISLESMKLRDSFPWFIVVAAIIGLATLIKKKFGVFIWFLATGVVSYGLIFRSRFQLGWEIFYGPRVANLEIVQILLVCLAFIFGVFIFRAARRMKQSSLFIWLFPLSFGIDWLINVFRLTSIQNEKYFGFLYKNVYFIGVKCGQICSFCVQKYSPNIANAFLRFPFDKVFGSGAGYIFVYPFIHLLLAISIYFALLKLPRMVRKNVIIFLIILFICQIIFIFKTDPSLVLPVKL